MIPNWRTPSRYVRAPIKDAAARRLVHSGDGADERALARAVRSDNRDDRSLLDLERDVIERLRVAVKHVEIFDAEHQPTASAPR